MSDIHYTISYIFVSMLCILRKVPLVSKHIDIIIFFILINKCFIYFIVLMHFLCGLHCIAQLLSVMEINYSVNFFREKLYNMFPLRPLSGKHYIRPQEAGVMWSLLRVNMFPFTSCPFLSAPCPLFRRGLFIHVHPVASWCSG